MRVIIIGAGAAGLACVTTLLEAKFPPGNVIVLEAENRIGGRIYTQRFGDSVIEIGAQWVHGEKDNCAFSMGMGAGELLSENSYQSSGISDDVEVVDWNGKVVDSSLCLRFREVMNSIDEKSMEDLKNWTSSLGDYFEQEFEEHMKKDLANDDPLLCRSLLEWYHKFENCIDGADSWFETAGKGHTEYWECFGDPLVMWKRGFCSLFDILTKNLPKCENGLAFPLADRILFNKDVCSLQWDNGVNKGVIVRCADGSVYEADMVVITVSLGVLKANQHAWFHPPLPISKSKAIEHLAFGTVDKIFLEFENPWWNADCGGFSFLQLPRETPTRWSDTILGFYTVRNQPNLLIAWITGAAARDMEKQSDEIVLKSCYTLLQAKLGQRFHIDLPVKMYRSTWHQKKNFSGSYSFRSMDSDHYGVTAADLAQPVWDSLGKKVLLFAGEATHKHYYSTVHGAIESGQREAYQIISSSQNKLAKL